MSKEIRLSRAVKRDYTVNQCSLCVSHSQNKVDEIGGRLLAEANREGAVCKQLKVSEAF